MYYLKHIKSFLSPVAYYEFFRVRLYSSFILLSSRQQTVSELSKNLSGMKTVLDVGCGANSPLKNVKKEFFSEGIDSFRPNILNSQKFKIHDAYKIADVRELTRIYPPKSFDAVIGLEIIEHLNKKDGLKLISDMERIARKKVIVLTPSGFLRQKAHERNKGQEHFSGWTNKELKSLGLTCKGLHGLRNLKGAYGILKLRPISLWEPISDATYRILKYMPPELSFQLFCVKDIEKYERK